MKNRKRFYFSTQNTVVSRNTTLHTYVRKLFGKDTCEAQLVIITKSNILHLSVAAGEIVVEIVSYLQGVYTFREEAEHQEIGSKNGEKVNFPRDFDQKISMFSSFLVDTPNGLHTDFLNFHAR